MNSVNSMPAWTGAASLLSARKMLLCGGSENALRIALTRRGVGGAVPRVLDVDRGAVGDGLKPVQGHGEHVEDPGP